MQNQAQEAGGQARTWGALPQAFIVACVMTLVLSVLAQQTPIFDAFEFWTSDWRTALFSPKNKQQHPRVAMVFIDDLSLADFPYRVPIDRAYVADLVATLDQAGPQVLGLDLLFDQKTEPDKDRKLIETLKNAKSRIVLVSHDPRSRAQDYQRAFNAQFIADAGRLSGSYALQTEIDGIIRFRADPPPGGASFAEAMAKTAGVTKLPASRRISWLRTPETEEAFLIVYARDIMPATSTLSPERRASLLRSLKDKLIIVGGDPEDRGDAFLTPLSKLNSDTMPGALVHAQILAQIVDGRSFLSFPPFLTDLMGFIAAFAGFALGWRYHNSGLMTGAPPIVLFAVFDVIAFSQFNLILPFAIPACAWFGSVIIAQWSRRVHIVVRKKKRQKVQIS